MIRNDFEGGTYTESYILIEGDVATPETLSAIDKIETNIKTTGRAVAIFALTTFF
jgi:predicted RND superfamily exporter protein